MNWKFFIPILFTILFTNSTFSNAQGFYDFGHYDVFSEEDVFINRGSATFYYHNVAAYGSLRGSEYASYDFIMKRSDWLGALSRDLSEKLRRELQSMRVIIIEPLPNLNVIGLNAKDTEKVTKENVRGGFVKIIKIFLPMTSALNFANREKGFLTSRIHLVVYNLQYCEDYTRICDPIAIEKNGDYSYTDWYYRNGGIIFSRTKEIILQDADLSTLLWDILEQADELISEFALEYLKAQRD